MRARLLAALILVLAGPLAIALLIADAPLSTELIIFGVAVLIGVVSAVVVSGLLARPVEELSRAAAHASRELDVPLAGTDEIERLISAFTLMVDSVRRRTHDVEASRDEVRESVRRLGEALRSTHDLMKLLSVVLETALVAVGGQSGAVYLLSTRRSDMVVKVGRHLDPSVAEKRVQLGSGLAGWVAEHRTGVRVPGPSAPALEDPEPEVASALAVPLESQSKLLGVLAVYGRRTGEAFRDEDVETIDFLARQAGVGIDNILLHQEAQRQSITDGLTGIWNHRYFQMRYAQEFASAKRFERAMSLLVIDADDFKGINDRLGHQRGNATLIELASRLSHEVREVDTLARFGGEEFIVILPEIDEEGARVAAERIRARVSGTPFGEEGEEKCTVTVSIGYATYPGHGASQEELLKAADEAMYAAKAGGKDRVVGAGAVDGRPSLAPEGTRP